MRTRAHFVCALLFVCGCAQPALSTREDLSSGFPTGDLAGIDLLGFDLTKVDLTGVTSCMQGYKLCGTNCIQEASCCAPADCVQYPNSTAACIQGSCSYACNPGFRTCNGQCRMGNVCCVDSDCTPAPNSTGTKCNPQGECTFTGCAMGFYDINMMGMDGCECQDIGRGQACAMASSTGTIAIGSSQMVTGNLPAGMINNWFTVTFASPGTVNYHPHIVLSGNPGNQFAMDVVKDCTEAPIACAVETGTNATKVTDWEAKLTGGTPGSKEFAGVPAVGTASVVKVQVYRVKGNPSCENYVLTISN